MATDDTRFLVVGLGNPGGEYERHRHNIGFMAIDAIAKEHGARAPSKKFHGELAELELLIDARVAGAAPALSSRESSRSTRDGRAIKLLLLKPQTYMNNSGRAVQAAMAFYKLPPERVLVLHDELDLPPGKLRIKKGGGANGQNGIRDIDAAIGTEYWRARLGIGHPGDKARVHGHVLSAFGPDDAATTEKLLAALSTHFPLFFTHSPEALMSRVSELLVSSVEKKPKPVENKKENHLKQIVND